MIWDYKLCLWSGISLCHLDSSMHHGRSSGKRGDPLTLHAPADEACQTNRMTSQCSAINRESHKTRYNLFKWLSFEGEAVWATRRADCMQNSLCWWEFTFREKYLTKRCWFSRLERHCTVYFRPMATGLAISKANAWSVLFHKYIFCLLPHQIAMARHSLGVSRALADCDTYPQVAMQGGQVLDLQRYQAAAAQAQAQAQGMRASMPMGWRPQPGQDMRQTDWAALQQNPMFRLQMGQHAGQMNPQQGAGNLQMHQLQLLQQQQMQRLAAQQQQQQQAQQQQHSQQPGQSNDAATQRYGSHIQSNERPACEQDNFSTGSGIHMYRRRACRLLLLQVCLSQVTMSWL